MTFTPSIDCVAVLLDPTREPPDFLLAEVPEVELVAAGRWLVALKHRDGSVVLLLAENYEAALQHAFDLVAGRVVVWNVIAGKASEKRARELIAADGRPVRLHS